MITIVWLGWDPSRAWAAVNDDQLKAVYLYRFPMLADWPTQAKGEVTDYCITRESSTGDYLSEIIASKTSPARFIDLSQSDKSQTAICHILYVDGQDREHVVELAKRYPYALTIGTGVQFVSLGGMLAFIKVNNRIKPLISQNNVEKSSVRLRAQLLAISELAEEKK
ncbi:valyl-tRNA synthetase [Vibrio maritimus]|uniref:Valyl-tRNA synthetase n=1 Tax=Vibrio maritimus TaxID=990268 RepID=A0A090SX56_9VIBR|nr:valyl-tRNA synthetase [Vibrio maritimus]